MTSDELLSRAAPAPSRDLLVALSGGADSALAAWMAGRLAAGRVRAVHVHHGTPAADELAASAAAVAEELGIALEEVRVEVAGGASWEDQARQARWAALDARRSPGEAVVTGHHGDDLAETTFANLIRGAGASGLAAMAADRPGVWRPLLGMARDEVRRLVDELGLPYHDDPANEDLAHTRNRIRHDILPYLADQLNPQLSAALRRAAAALAADDAALEQAAAAAPIRPDAFGAWRIPAAVVAMAGPAVAPRMVRRLLRAARPPHAGTEAEVAAGLAVAAGAAVVSIGHGWFLEREGPWLAAHQGDVAAPAPVSCPVPGSTEFGSLPVCVRVAPTVLTRRTALMRADVLANEATLRSADPGERIDIVAGSKLVRDVQAEAEVPRRARPAWPVVDVGGRIAAVVAVRAAPWARGTLGDGGVYEVALGDARL